MTGDYSPLLVLCVILLSGIAGGWLAERLRLPLETGYTVAGLLIGPMALNVFGDLDPAKLLQPLSQFAMGVLAVSAGSHLGYRRIHNALRRIFVIALFESLGALVLVTLASHWLGVDWPGAFALGAIAMATSPATTITLVRELRARGAFVKTLLSVVALDIILCLMAFTLATRVMDYAYSGGAEGGGLAWAVALGAAQFAESLLLGILMGWVTERLVLRGGTHKFSVIFLVLLFLSGVSDYLGADFLITSIFLGVYLANASDEAARQTKAMEPIEPLLYVCFFTAAGASLHLDSVAEAGALCAAYMAARFAGKYIGAFAGGWLVRAPGRIWHNLGLALMPQAGVAIGMVLLLKGDPDVPGHTASVISTLVLGAITLNEIIGPLFTWRALHRAGEINLDRRRLIEFLQEEFITTSICGADKWEALKSLTSFYSLTHNLSPEARAELEADVLEREKEFTTAIGHGAAIPHGRVGKGRRISGVMGICHDGVDFGAYDHEPVKILVLVVTPKGMENQHLEVMASLAMMVRDGHIRERLVSALSPYDAWEVIESRDARTYNQFLEEEDGEENAPA